MKGGRIVKRKRNKFEKETRPKANLILCRSLLTRLSIATRKYYSRLAPEFKAYVESIKVIQ
jgi:hypothetical protein